MASTQSTADPTSTPQASPAAKLSASAERRPAYPKESRAPQAKLTAKGQMTIPKEVRDRLGLKPGDKVKFFFDQDGRASIRPLGSITALRGIFKDRASKPVTMEEMDEAIAEGAVERYRRYLSQ